MRFLVFLYKVKEEIRESQRQRQRQTDSSFIVECLKYFTWDLKLKYLQNGDQWGHSNYTALIK